MIHLQYTHLPVIVPIQILMIIPLVQITSCIDLNICWVFAQETLLVQYD